MGLSWQQGPLAFSNNPHLQDLSLRSTAISPHLLYQQIVRYGGFGAVNRIYIEAPVERCADVILAMGKNIRCLHLRCYGSETVHETAQALRRIVEHCSSNVPEMPPSTFRRMAEQNLTALFFPGGIPKYVAVSHLTDVELDFSNDCRNETAQAAVVLAPLRLALNLQSLSVTHTYPLVYSEDDLGNMLGMWQNMRSLSLNPRPSRNAVAPQPLTILSAVASSGPSLQKFAAMVGKIGTATLQAPDKTWSPGVRVLDLGYSNGERGRFEEVAQYIQALFGTVSLETNDCSPWVGHVATAFANLPPR